jgi:hypothetical protein
MKSYIRDYIILGLITVMTLSCVIYLSFFVTQHIEYELNDRFNMTNCLQVKEGSPMKLTYGYYEGIVICDEGEYTYQYYVSQYTLEEVIRFKELLDELEGGSNND